MSPAPLLPDEWPAPAPPPLARPLTCLAAGSAAPGAWLSGGAPELLAATLLLAAAGWVLAKDRRRRLLLALLLLAGVRATVQLAAESGPTGNVAPGSLAPANGAPASWFPLRGDRDHTDGLLAPRAGRLRISSGALTTGDQALALGGVPRLLAAGPLGEGTPTDRRSPGRQLGSPAGPKPGAVPGIALTTAARRDVGSSARTGANHGRPRVAHTEVPGASLVRLAVRCERPWDAAIRFLRRLRAAGCARLSALDDRRLPGFLSALVFGERADLDFGLADLFTRTGTRHLLALSGLHVVLAAALFAWPLGGLAGCVVGALTGWLPGRCPLRREDRVRWTRAVVRALAVLCFVPLGGGGVPVARAAVAAALAALAPALSARGLPRGAGLPVDGRNLWCCALGAELLLRPLCMREVGVQLSYGAALGLLLTATRVQASLLDLLPGRGHLAPSGPTGLARPPACRALASRGASLVAGTLAASLVATAWTLPIVWLRFGEWSPAGMIATPLAVPAIACLLGLGALHCALPWTVPESWLRFLFHGLTNGLEHVDRWPWTPAVLPAGSPWPVLVGAALLAPWALARGVPFPRRRCALAALTFLGCTALELGAPERQGAGPNTLEIVALDVGHGTAVVLRSPESGTWLFDAGSRDRLGVARSALLPILRRWGPGPLTIVASHLDRDHVGALDWVAQRFAIRAWYGADPFRGSTAPGNAPRVDLRRGRALLASRGPFQAWLLRGRDADGNEGSRMLEIAYGQSRVLLTGDAEAGGLRDTLDHAPPRGPVDLLLLPHHGSHTEQLEPLLDLVRPARAWASASRYPPAAEPVRRRGIPLEVTWERGALTWRVPRRNSPDQSH